MPFELASGRGLLYMKVGTHAQESLEHIIARKRKEIEDAGVAFWGYGGNTCHPERMVQPFVKSFERHGGTIYLCMEPMNSKHFADQVAADEYSSDGVLWHPIPAGINVLGSRYALAITELEPAEFELPLSSTRVAIGNSKGAIGAKYISGRVDKACLEVVDVEEESSERDATMKKIGLVARIVDPYAVYLRNRH